MAVRLFEGRRLAGLAAAGFILAAAGCQAGDTLGGISLPGSGGSAAQQAPDNRITAEELVAYCPQVTVRQSDAFYDSYPRNVSDDASQLIFRASVGETTRACRYGAGTLGMTVAMSGRVIPGPNGKAGPVRLPIRISVVRDGEVLYSQTRDFEVMLNDTAGATQFVFSDENISVPSPTTQNYAVYVGYDVPARR